MSGFKFSRRSWSRLDQVHPKLIALAALALQKTTVDFGIERGIRTLEEQAEYVRLGWSTTMNSRHLPQEDGYSHAIDVKAYGKNVDPWGKEELTAISQAFKASAEELGIKITWGGDWKSFIDRPHYQLEER